MAEAWDYPPAQGLYDPARETAACGVGFIVNIDGVASAKVSCAASPNLLFSCGVGFFVFFCLFFFYSLYQSYILHTLLERPLTSSHVIIITITSMLNIWHSSLKTLVQF